MTNFETAREALDTSMNSAGSAMKEHEKWQQSLEARINSLKASWQALSQVFLKSDFLKGALDAVIGLVDGIEALVDTIGVIPTLATAFGIFQSFKGEGFFQPIIDEATGAAKGITSVFGKAANSVKATLSSINTNNGFSASLNQDDVASLIAYNGQLQAGVDKTIAWNDCMANASVAAQNAARSNAFLSDGLNGYIKAQQAANISTIASNKSLGSAKALLQEYYSGCQTTGMGVDEFRDAVAKTNPQLAAQMTATGSASAGLRAYALSTVVAKAGALALKVAVMALNAALTMGIGLIVGELISAVTKWFNKEKELAETVEEVTSKFEEQHKELQKLKGDYNTDNESSMINRYEKLSKGVDNLGRNVSLTADEYSEYQSIVNQIADQMPSLVTGFDSQGNAILSCKDNVAALTAEYERLIKANNDSILTDNLDKIAEDYKNKLSTKDNQGFWKSLGSTFFFDDLGWMDIDMSGMAVDYLKQMVNAKNDAELDGIISRMIGHSDALHNYEGQIKTALESAGYDTGVLGFNIDEVLKDLAKNNPKKLQEIIDKYEVDLEQAAVSMKAAAKAALSNALDISDSEYYDISDTMKNVASNIINGLDNSFYSKYVDNPYGIVTYVDDMLGQLKAIGEDGGANIEAAFNLKTQFNGGDISYGEYVKGLESTGETIDKWVADGKLDKDIGTQLKLSLGLDEYGLVAEYKQLKNRLADKDLFNIKSSEYESFLEGLSAEELSVLIDIIPELSETDYKETIADVKAALEKEMMLQGLTFDLNLEVETAGIEALNTALAESVSATGLSSESITALKGRYADLEGRGYDLSSMFEETSTGIRLNRQEFDKLENAYATQKLAEVDSELEKMKSTYDDLGEAIKNTDDPIRKAELFNDRQTLAKRISEAATLAHQYKGLTSAYNDWLSAEEAGQERDMYENVIKGFETIDDELSRGWVDDGTIEFLELLTGRTDLAGKSGKQLKEVYDGLDKTIGKSGYSIRDFFTVNEDGDSTNTGVYNFLETVESFEDKLGDVISRDGDGNIIGFDFQVAGGDEVIAETLGVSEELVQIMVRAADDAGFVVSMDGTYRQLADLQNEAKAAANYLKEIGKTDVDFDFNTTSVENLKTQLAEAHKILDDEKFWNKDGTFNFNADGATQAMQVVSTLQAKLDKLTEEKYGIGLTVDDEEFEEPLEKLQEYGKTIQSLNQLQINPKANAKEIKELEGDLKEISEYFANLDGETKVKLGLDADDNWEEVKKKIENGEVKIPTVLDIQANMDKNIETLTDLALLNSGLLSESQEETIRKKYKVEVESEVEAKNSYVDPDIMWVMTPDEQTRYKNVEVIAETMGVEDVGKLSKELKELDDKTVQAIAKAVGEGDVEALDKAIKGMDDKTVQAIAKALGYSDVETLKDAINNMQGNKVDAEVNTDGQQEKINTLQSWIDGLKGKNVVIDLIVSGVEHVKKLLGIGEVNGTANVDGTAFANGTSGRAFKQGDWRTKKTETALTGELGQELVVTGNRWYTVGDNGAEFAKIPKGSIVFNHKQTEEIFKHGRVISGGGRGKAFADGTAFSSGSGGIGKVKASSKKKKSETTTKTTTKKTKDATTTTTTTTTKTLKRANNSNGSISSSGGTDKVEGSAVGTQDKFEETFDWIEVLFSRLERSINKLDEIVNDTAKSWSARNNALNREMAEYRQLYADAQQASNVYYGELEGALSDIAGASDWQQALKYRDSIHNGSLNLEDIKDESLLNAINKYKDLYDKMLDADDKADKALRLLAEGQIQKFENIQSEYDGILQGFEHTETMLNEYISQAEAQGYIASKEYYQALKTNKQSEIDELIKEQSDLIEQRDAAVASGDIAEGSQAWRDMCAEIDSVTQAIEEGNTALIEYANSMRDIDWSIFDLIQERISDVTSEADFLIDLMSYDKLFDDNGNMTDKGLATMGLHGQNYNTYMYAADEYGNKVKEIDAKIASGELDGYSKDVIDKRQEYVDLQRESILAAEDEKQAIKDLVEEGINLELDALQERIDLHNEELDSMKDLYDYQKNIQKQSEEIASLEKQRAAYLGDDSEESKAKLQEITVSLKEAKENLQETEFDRYISQQEQLLSSLYEEYELTLSTRLDDISGIMTDSTEAINTNAKEIGETLSSAMSNVGMTLSEAMTGIWNGEGGDNAKSVLTSYGDKITGESPTSLVSVLNGIKANVDAMVDDVDKEAQDKVNEKKTDTSANANPTRNKPIKPPKGSDNTTSGGDGKPKVGDKVKFLNGKYYYDSQGKTPVGSKYHGQEVYITKINNKKWATHPYHIAKDKDGKHPLGWLKLNQISGYATGKKNFLDNEIAWTQEKGQEYIIRPSDGAILTPIAKGDSVLNAQASGNIWNMANNPAEFIKDSLKLDVANVPNGSNVSNVYSQTIENVTFSMPNVHSYNEMLTQMQKDPKFDKLIKAMTIEQIAGKSSLVKNKSIR